MNVYVNPRQNKAALILASMSPDMIDDIIDLVNARQRGIHADIAAASDLPVAPLAVFSRDFIRDADFPLVYNGFSLVVLSSIARVKPDFDFYQSVLEGAYRMPSSMSAAIAKRIETEDIINSSKDAETSSWLNRVANQGMEYIRQGSNWITGVLNLPLENDQTQVFDVDFLYELRKLGEVANDMNARTRLIVGQSRISRTYGLFVEAGSEMTANNRQTTNPNAFRMPSAMNLGGGQMRESFYRDGLSPQQNDAEYGDVEINDKQLDAMLTYVIMHQAVHNLPPSATKNITPVIAPFVATQIRDIENAFAHVPESRIRASLGRIASGEASKNVKGLSLGKFASLLPGMGGIRKIGELFKGDAELQDLSDIAETYGDDVAQAWQQGDIERAVGLIEDLAAAQEDDVTTGDAELDEGIATDVLESCEHDINPLVAEGALSPEMGGLFTKARINKNLRAAARKQRRADKKSNRIARRELRKNNLIASRDARSGAGYIQPEPVRRPTYEEVYGMPLDEGTMMQEPLEGPGFDTYQGDNANMGGFDLSLGDFGPNAI